MNTLIQPVPEMVAAALVHFSPEGSVPNRGSLFKLREAFDKVGPWNLCKELDLLVNNSGEDFALQFMPYFNRYQYTY